MAMVVDLRCPKKSKQFIRSASNALLTLLHLKLHGYFTCHVVSGWKGKYQRWCRPICPTTCNHHQSCGHCNVWGRSALFFCQILLNLSIPAQIGVFITAIVAGRAQPVFLRGLGYHGDGIKKCQRPYFCHRLLLPFDRILDRLRTMTNVWGDFALPLLIASREKHSR